MIVYILGLFMTIIDGTMVNVALPTMADDFGVAVDRHRVGRRSATSSACAAMIPVAGWLGDRFGIEAGVRRAH